MRRLFLILALMLMTVPAFAYESAQGWCEKGGVKVSTGGLTSSTNVQASYPSCTVTVYVHGTSTLATIYSDNAATPTPIPGGSFSATTTGHWTFYAANGSYDIVLSGGGFSAPFTISDVIIGGSSGTNCVNSPGSDFGQVLAACLASLPNTGGIANMSDFTGAQAMTSDPFLGVTKNATVIYGAAQLTISTTVTSPGNILFTVPIGASFNPAAGKTLTVLKPIEAGDYPIFGGAGEVRLRAPIHSAWWLTGGTGTAADPYTSVDGTGGLMGAFNALKNSQTPESGTIIAPCGQITVSTGAVWSYDAVYSSAAEHPFPILDGCGLKNTVFVGSSGVTTLTVTANIATSAWTGGAIRNVGFSHTGTAAPCVVFQGANRFIFENNRVTSCTDGVQVIFSFQWNILKNQIQSNTRCAIRLSNAANDGYIVGNQLGNNLVCGIDLVAAVGQPAASNLTIAGNNMESNPTVLFIGTGNNVKFDSNRCESVDYCVRVGIDAAGSTAGNIPDRTVLSNLLIANVGVAGVDITRSSRLWYQDADRIGTNRVPTTFMDFYSAEERVVVNAETSFANADALFSVKNDTRDWSFGVRADVSDYWCLRDRTASQDRICVTDSGDTGIGTNSPQSKLDVNGSVTIATSGAIRSAGARIISVNAPTSCAGSGCAIVSGSSNSFGKVTTTTTGAASIVITFSDSFTTAPACTVQNETTANILKPTSTTTQLTIAGTTVSGDSLVWNCGGLK